MTLLPALNCFKAYNSNDRISVAFESGAAVECRRKKGTPQKQSPKFSASRSVGRYTPAAAIAR